ncbi:MAG: protein kinase [Verrucomicrobiales bacterium]|nr:protein kinase [Verrucomicrobiales bacterium]
MDQAESIFEQVLELSLVERAGFLSRVCAGDSELRRRVEKFVEAHERAQRLNFFSSMPDVSEQLGDQIDRYKLLEKIGEGGCGVVYVAEQAEPVRRRVALKVIKLGMDTKAVVARFEAERQALAMMDHPNIARVFDAGATESGRPFFIMELVRGIRITEYCDENNLSTRQRLDLFIKVCQAIQHAHQKGIIHRDIKPSNILVTLHDGVPVPKVIDFGIAKAIEGRLTDATVYTQLQQFIGTPAYMSPEQAELSGLDIDTRSDIYGLGVLLYELLTGHPPFDGRQLVASGIDAMRKTIREKEPTRPSTRLTQEFAGVDVRRLKLSTPSTAASQADSRVSSRRLLQIKEALPLIRGDLDWIVMKCLEKDRSRRYDTANGLAADLTRHLNNEPVSARPPSAAYKFQKAWRRNRLSFMAAASVAMVLLLGMSVSLWQAFRAHSQKLVAEHHLYIANVNRAGQAWEHENFSLLTRLLEETRAFPNRGFEWFYWQNQAHRNLTTLRGHTGAVHSLAFSRDGRHVITGSEDQTARVWDAIQGRELFPLVGHSKAINSVAISPDGQRIATGSSDHTARVWDGTTGRPLLQFQHDRAINAVAFSPDGERIVTGSSDQTARVWELATQRLLVTLKGHTNRINAVDFSPDGQRIVTGSDDKTAKVWNAETGEELFPIRGHRTEVRAAAFSPDGQWIFTGGTELIGRIWDAATGQNLIRTLDGRGPMTSVAFSGDGERVVTGSWDTTANVWETRTGTKLSTISGHRESVRSVAFSRDGQRIATGGADNEVKLWTASGERNPLTIRAATNVLAVALSPDGRRIVGGSGGQSLNEFASGSGEHAARVWDTASGKLLFSLSGHTSGVSSAAFSSDGQRMVTGSGDKTAIVWDAFNGQQLLILTGHNDSVNSVAISHDGRRGSLPAVATRPPVSGMPRPLRNFSHWMATPLPSALSRFP